MSQLSTAVACLIVPSGRWELQPIVDAIRATSGASIDSIVAVWCGDPHLRPALAEDLNVRWADLGLDEPTGLGWNRLLVAMEPRPYEWARAAAAITRLLDEGAESVVALRVGSVGVLGDLATLSGESQITLLSRADGELSNDGLAPTEADVIALGRHSAAVARFAAGAQPALGWLSEQLPGADEDVAPWLGRALELFGGSVLGSPQFVAAGWSLKIKQRAALIDLDQLDRQEPWHFAFATAPARVRLSADAILAADVTEGFRQCQGSPEQIMLPGGIPVTGAVRRLMRDAIRNARAGTAPLPCEPFGSQHSLFTAWLESSESARARIGRYWLAVRDQRADLQTIFPQPEGADAAGLREWADESWRLERGTALLRPHVDPGDGPIVSEGFDPAGINVLGYLDFDQGLGEIARQIVTSLTEAGVPVSALNYWRSHNQPKGEITLQAAARFKTNVVVVTAAQFVFVVADHGETLLRNRHTIGYWFWELERVTAEMIRAIDDVDEIWAGSQFVAEAFRAVTDKPVHCVPLPIARPQPSSRDRVSFGLPPDRFIFVTTFDQLSVPERKNPFGVIEAFSRAFAEDEGPLLWVKTMNGHQGWSNHERLLLAAAGRRDIVVWDSHLSHADHMAVLNVSDCLVSLHRSEGLGLQCAEAMWLGKPVIATRYSGNLDFMDDDCAALIDYELVPVRHGHGIYPPDALWADPDLEQAARWMRRLVQEPALGASMGEAAHAKMRTQKSPADAGRMMARLAGLRSAEVPPGARRIDHAELAES